jgi:hypothetical protein
VFIQQARAVSSFPFFGDLRVEVTNQLTITSNAPTQDRKLTTALRKALTLIDKANPTNVVSDTKTLTMLTTTLNKSSLSNVFDAELQAIVDAYASTLLGAELSLSNRLTATFPSGPNTAAQRNLDQVLAALNSGEREREPAVAAKAIAPHQEGGCRREADHQGRECAAAASTRQARLVANGKFTSYSSRVAAVVPAPGFFHDQFRQRRKQL